MKSGYEGREEYCSLLGETQSEVIDWFCDVGNHRAEAKLKVFFFIDITSDCTNLQVKKHYKVKQIIKFPCNSNKNRIGQG